MADFTNRNADETKQFILTFDENGGSPEYTKIEDANGVDRTAEVVELLGINDKEDADSTILKEGDVEDSLNSTSTTKPLSANQGKQLNDDKASLSGGVDANFAAMPWVEGSPIVERDSNSNGEFVRFANDVVISTIRSGSISMSAGEENISHTIDYPIAFSQVWGLQLNAYSVSDSVSGGYGAQVAIRDADNRIGLASVNTMIKNNSSQSNTNEIYGTVIGLGV